MILDVNKYNLKTNDQIYSSHSSIYSCCLRNIIFLDQLEFKRKKNDSFKLNNRPYRSYFSHNLPNF